MSFHLTRYGYRYIIYRIVCIRDDCRGDHYLHDLIFAAISDRLKDDRNKSSKTREIPFFGFVQFDTSSLNIRFIDVCSPRTS